MTRKDLRFVRCFVWIWLAVFLAILSAVWMFIMELSVLVRFAYGVVLVFFLVLLVIPLPPLVCAVVFFGRSREKTTKKLFSVGFILGIILCGVSAFCIALVFIFTDWGRIFASEVNVAIVAVLLAVSVCSAKGLKDVGAYFLVNKE